MLENVKIHVITLEKFGILAKNRECMNAIRVPNRTIREGVKKSGQSESKEFLLTALAILKNTNTGLKKFE